VEQAKVNRSEIATGGLKRLPSHPHFEMYSNLVALGRAGQIETRFRERNVVPLGPVKRLPIKNLWVTDHIGWEHPTSWNQSFEEL
jgi:hypothetical protein